jgi:VanZ family protein
MVPPRINPWTWPLALFGLQTLGAMLFPAFIGLDWHEVAVPIALLILGTMTALLFLLWPNSSRLGRWKWWLPVVVYALFIFLMSHSSYDVEDPPGFDLSLFHPIIYASLGFLLAMAWDFCFAFANQWLVFTLALATGTIYGILDEFHQSFVPERFPGLMDVLLDVLGSTMGIGAFLHGQRRSWIARETR